MYKEGQRNLLEKGKESKKGFKVYDITTGQ